VTAGNPDRCAFDNGTSEKGSLYGVFVIRAEQSIPFLLVRRPFLANGAKCCWCGELLRDAGPNIFLCPTQICRDRQIQWAIQQKNAKGVISYLYVPTPRQVEFHEAPTKHTIFGGAAGPGKSHALRWDLYIRCLRQPGYEALLLRRTFPELEKTHIRKAAREAPQLGAVLVTSEHVVRFSNGSLLEFGHCDNDGAISKYLSTEYDAIGFDELVTFERDIALEIMTRARTSKPGLRAMVKAGSNPGGVGALWVLDFFIDHRVDAERYPFYKPEDWGFIPANLDDNPYRDLEYEQSLTVLDPARYQQLRFGNWRVFDGQMFGAWDERKHVVSLTIPTPAQQTWFCSMDWGFNAPGVCLWWVAAADGHYLVVDELKFKETPVRDVARMIKEKTKALGIKKVPQVWADPAIWQRHGQVGEAIAETFGRLGVPVTKSNNDRMNGWQRLQEMLRDAPDGRPWLQVDRSCRYLTRTIPAAVRDKTNEEDLDTAGDDHALDALRYGAMSRRRFNGHAMPMAFLPGSIGALVSELRGPERLILGRHSAKEVHP
jgi:phage terminase large subunit